VDGDVNNSTFTNHFKERYPDSVRPDKDVGRVPQSERQVGR
jgi:hypothetical protein